MNRINKLFHENKNRILSVYFTAGFPQLNDTNKILKGLIDNGADMIEIGIPFSDPLADGPVIQHSSETALKNGMNLKLLFEQLQTSSHELQTPNSELRTVPLLLMGYLNPVLQYGMQKFVLKCKEVGIDGVIIPDLPLAEFETHYKKLFSDNDLKNIFLVTPQTSEERLKKIDDISDSFIYLVSSSSTTGMKKGFSEEQLNYFQRIKNSKLKNPTLIGFGISDSEGFEKVCEYANGAIVGSAFIKATKDSENPESDISKFINSLRTENSNPRKSA